ncbi:MULTISPECIES: hypothetical protein [Natronorubrum]|uniref:Uncharacterized protein n=2 Tax=Natronorubrum bangense TaxID=61858 RepID=L9WEZ0_9EURY|nr:hypothetical protein [Natronorubrum bangense]ELY47927.1 hypothetical protein C494_12035 [Natronorubrum bangense JCM 10635]QCC53608.1 hypothetical protein DV706_03385 [Natronorubrum bangense]
MDVTQIGLGVTLLIFGTLTLAGPASFVSGTAVYLLTGVTLFITGYALLIGISQRRYSNQS